MLPLKNSAHDFLDICPMGIYLDDQALRNSVRKFQKFRPASLSSGKGNSVREFPNFHPTSR
jgi:hypothetical protein